MFIPNPGEAHIFPLSLDLPPGAADKLLYLLSTDERSRACRFRRPLDRHRFVIARAGLRKVLGQVLDLAPDALAFGYGPFGKPHFLSSQSSPRPPLAFNLSHAGDLAVIAITNGPAVGVDLEQMQDAVDVDGIATHFFAPEEQEELAALPPEARRNAFYRFWTAKEAFAKGLGDGLRLPLSSFTVTVAGDELILMWPDDPARAAGWTLVELEISPGYAAALAVDGPVTRVHRMAIGSPVSSVDDQKAR